MSDEKQDVGAGPEVGETVEPGTGILSIKYDAKANIFGWAIGGQIPIQPLIGMLELVKSMLLDKQKMEIAAQIQREQAGGIVLPNGPIPGPMPHNRMRH